VAWLQRSSAISPVPPAPSATPRTAFSGLAWDGRRCPAAQWTARPGSTRWVP
jgi:hypothetical protein